MATTNLPSVRTDTDRFDARSLITPAAYAAQLLAIIAGATGAAVLLVGFTTGLGGFVLVAGGWLAVVSASPALAERGTARLSQLEFGHPTPRSTRTVTAVIASLLAR